MADIILDHYTVRIKHFLSKIAYSVYVWMSGGVRFGGARFGTGIGSSGSEVRGAEPVPSGSEVRRYFEGVMVHKGGGRGKGEKLISEFNISGRAP